ncbi:Rieske (2Fe-2S) protein [uncultured Thalassolituus sp.]|uniref:Rieske (2Fe-2S) protein n=1 Tax=uncultured Thalassolituus sp. TaxID=285273 RepID=UPI00260B68AC|nr:Rieske (2Fe-2S) protein [uncultured Thalassolituus sp.]
MYSLAVFLQPSSELMTFRTLCTSSELTEGESRGFEPDGQALFIVRHRSHVYAYRNHCPHLGIPLEWQPDQFLDSDGSLIQCAMHGALFLIDSGHCISGPCTGQSLKALPCREIDGKIEVDLTPEATA